MLHIIGDESPGRNGKSESIKAGAATAAVIDPKATRKYKTAARYFKRGAY